MLRFILIAASVITLSSCSQREDYTCVCRTGGQVVEEQPYMNVTEKHAKSSCKKKHDDAQPPAGTQYLVSTSCVLE